MEDIASRLRQARIEAKFETASEAARAHHWKPGTYIHHENGTRGISPEMAATYARAYKKPVEWLLYGRHPRKGSASEAPATVPLVGYVAAGSRTHYFSDVREEIEPEMVPAPPRGTAETVAVEIRGESLGAGLDRWIAYYDDVHRPATAALSGRLCVVGLADGRIMIKIMHRSPSGLFHLMSNAANDSPILDAEVDWAAPVIAILPRSK